MGRSLAANGKEELVITQSNTILCCYRETEQSEISSVVLFIYIYDDESRYVGFNMGILGRVIPDKGKLIA